MMDSKYFENYNGIKKTLDIFEVYNYVSFYVENLTGKEFRKKHPKWISNLHDRGQVTGNYEDLKLEGSIQNLDLRFSLVGGKIY